MQNVFKAFSKWILIIISIHFCGIEISANAQSKHGTYSVINYGITGDGKTVNTDRINQLIELCSKNGGGKIIFPAGEYLSGTIFLRSNITLELQSGVKITGVNDMTQYHPFVPNRDFSKYNTVSASGNNANSAYDTVWTKTLLLGVDIHDVTIEGDGVIDGRHVFNAKGEEGMRGPHAILLAGAKRIKMKGITVERASNYALLAYELGDCTFDHVTFREGWDGIHMRGAENIIIKNCRFQTGDDAIAGGYWKNVQIKDCDINSSCNGIRIIMPVSDVKIRNSLFHGPGVYPHRTSGAAHRTNMLTGIYIQPGGWGSTKGNIENVELKDISFYDMYNAVTVELNEENNGLNFKASDLRIAHVSGPVSFRSNNGGLFENVHFQKVHFDFTSGSQTQTAFNLAHIRTLYLSDIGIFNKTGKGSSEPVKMEDIQNSHISDMKIDSALSK